MAGKTGGFEVAERALHGLHREPGMLHVEKDEVGAGRLQDVSDSRRGELNDEVA
jgi:hypothetical protein